MSVKYLDIVSELRQYVENEGFKGHDPYDLLSSSVDFESVGPKLSFILTQINKHSLFNIRKFIGVPKLEVPKGIALFLEAYCKLFKLTQDESLISTIEYLKDRLIANRSPGYSMYCWGLNYDYASRIKFAKAKHPSVVITSFGQKALAEYNKLFPSEEMSSRIVDVAKYVTDILPKTETDEGLCISYTDIERDICYNANAHGFEILMRSWSLSNNRPLLELAQRSLEFTLKNQKQDGHWNYRRYANGTEKVQIDFHQGFIIESLRCYANCIGEGSSEIEHSITRGLEFYFKNQFLAEGRSLGRLPNIWPVDIHSQAQGIITFSRSGHIDMKYPAFAESIAEYTISHMMNENGSFGYKRYKFGRNQIPYIRWGQAWMLLALVTLLENRNST